MLVLDAAAAVDLLVGPAELRDQIGRSLAGGSPLLAPDLITSEVVSALSGIARGGALTWREARQALDAYAELPVRRVETHPLRSRIFDLSRAMSAYDATYVALAEVTAASLLTTDRRLARTVRTVDVVVPR